MATRRNTIKSNSDSESELAQAENDITAVNKDDPKGIPVSQVVRNELLCYLFNNLNGSLSKSVVVARIVAFYSTHEILEAKTIFFENIEISKRSDPTINTLNLQKIVKRSNDIKNVDEIYETYKKLTEKRCVVPTYYAVDLEKIPPSATTSNYLGELTSICNNIQSNVLKLCDHIQSQDSASQQITVGLLPTNGAHKLGRSKNNELLAFHDDTTSENHQTRNQVLNHATAIYDEANNAPVVSLLSATSQSQNLYARAVSSNNGMQARQSLNTQGKLAFSGTKPRNTCKIKTAPKKYSVFAGNFDIDTTESELVAFLNEAGIRDVRVKRLPGERDGYTFKTAAYVVTFDSIYKDLIYDYETWPDECNVREWVNKPSVLKKRQGASVPETSNSNGGL